MRTMALKEVRAAQVLYDTVKSFPTQREAAAHLKITPAYLSDLLNNRRDISDSILAKLGLRRATVIVGK